jgi:hypothetical protein
MRCCYGASSKAWRRWHPVAEVGVREPGGIVLDIGSIDSVIDHLCGGHRFSPVWLLVIDTWVGSNSCQTVSGRLAPTDRWS